MAAWSLKLLRLQKDVHLGAGFIGAVGRVQIDLSDLVLADEVALGRYDLHIGMDPVQHPAAGVALAAATARGRPTGGKGQGGLALAHPRRSGEQIGMRSSLLQRALRMETAISWPTISANRPATVLPDPAGSPL